MPGKLQSLSRCTRCKIRCWLAGTVFETRSSAHARFPRRLRHSWASYVLIRGTMPPLSMIASSRVEVENLLDSREYDGHRVVASPRVHSSEPVMSASHNSHNDDGKVTGGGCAKRGVGDIASFVVQLSLNKLMASGSDECGGLRKTVLIRQALETRCIVLDVPIDCAPAASSNVVPSPPSTAAKHVEVSSQSLGDFIESPGDIFDIPEDVMGDGEEGEEEVDILATASGKESCVLSYGYDSGKCCHEDLEDGVMLSAGDVDADVAGAAAALVRDQVVPDTTYANVDVDLCEPEVVETANVPLLLDGSSRRSSKRKFSEGEEERADEETETEVAGKSCHVREDSVGLSFGRLSVRSPPASPRKRARCSSTYTHSVVTEDFSPYTSNLVPTPVPVVQAIAKSSTGVPPAPPPPPAPPAVNWGAGKWHCMGDLSTSLRQASMAGLRHVPAAPEVA